MLVLALVAVCALALPAPGQEAAASPEPKKPSRVFGVLPNYRTIDSSEPFKPIGSREKLHIAYKDATDFPLFILTGFFAGVGQWQGTNPSYGGGMKGFARRYGASYADQSMGTMFTEGLFPVAFHQDPRYFRKGTGSVRSRTVYAISRMLITRDDHGNRAFNFSEVGGTAAMTAISTAYSPATRSVSGGLQKFGMNIGIDAAGAVLKEFWPDIRAHLHRRRASKDQR